MRDKIVKYFKEILLFFLVMTIFANILSFYRSNNLNKEALNISTVNLLHDKSYVLPKNEPILIHFWASWCPTCKVEAPNIQKISKSYNVLTIALKSGSDAEIEEYLKSRDLNFKVVNDIDGAITDKFSVSIFPTTIIYDKDGEVVFSDVGYTSTLGLWLRMWWTN
ncbi:MAG: thioredoxin [Sulfurimonas sp. RIFCSPLOWO2_12_36_12]|uniref:protein disulfide oxidoreductase n=1 Tax=Sulfurimonas sp. RIFCSPLOWO2_12_36_12 TaxID=1802253 RepID=UPI0008C06CB4|nr:protein disulfide oxidoreductase [Sulfurimonas sp. RIFCSPLOWO2_12_36_12]OHE00003.1 MAG: thioredoxin [Sulfurimonas sp. RIFCSPLOWO2_02_FULL_36_28]OHE01175.1 MAG: thioredoxin [Sulfurimonas sp. RIFCSPLOWO2_12_36_12]